MLNELFKKEGHSIFTFKPGDIITRVVPQEMKRTIHNDNLGIDIEVVERVDKSFRGEKLKYLGIANNMIYVKHKGDVIDFEIESWSEGWDLYETPPKKVYKNLSTTA